MLHAVVESEQTKVELLLTHGCPTRPMSSLLRAVAGGHLDAARRLAADSALHLLPCRTKPTRCSNFVLGPCERDVDANADGQDQCTLLWSRLPAG